MANKESLKVSSKAKSFLDNMMTNRIKLDLEKLNSYSEAIELIKFYFNKNNDRYLEMLKGDKNVL